MADGGRHRKHTWAALVEKASAARATRGAGLATGVSNGIMGAVRIIRCSLGVVVLGVVLGSCLAADRTGVRFAKNGEPVVVNCGTWIQSVAVSDADSGRRLWAAHASPTDKGIDDVGSVVVGELPAPSWVEDSSLALEPRPTRWRFDVRALRGEVTVVVEDEQLRPGRVYRPGGASESASDFYRQTCNGFPLPGAPFWIAMGVVLALIAGAVTVGILISPHRRHRVSSYA